MKTITGNEEGWVMRDGYDQKLYAYVKILQRNPMIHKVLCPKTTFEKCNQ